jgi:flagella basal body P-ring formation protein FlgA
MVLLFAAALSVAAASSVTPEAWLERELHERYDNVTEWRIRELQPAHTGKELSVERIELGTVGARTLLIVHGRDAAGHAVTQRRWFDVSAIGLGAVLTQPLPALTPIPENAAILARIDRFAQPCGVVDDLERLRRKRLLVSRRAGEAVCDSMLGPIPDVARGATVTVEAIAGSVALQTEAVARTDAVVGQRVQLVRDPNRGIIWGVVTAPGRARVDD